MKIQEYFKAQKDIVCPDDLKTRIYNDILSKKDRNFLFSRMSFYHKVWIYFVFSLLLLISFYATYLVQPQNNAKIAKIWSGFILQENPSEWKNLAKANTVWKIIEAIWEIKIIKNWQESPSNIINHWDNILLLNNAQLKFEVSSGTIAFIKWPAEFRLEYIWENNWLKNYAIELISWDYFEVLENNTQDNNLIIKTQNFELESQKTNDSMNIKILWEWDKKIIENKWWAVVVKKIVNNKKVFSAIKTNQKAQVDEEVKIIEEIKQIKNELKTNQISWTYSLTGVLNSTDMSDISGITWEHTVTYQTPQTNNIIEQSKKVLDMENMEKLKDLTYPWFIMKDIENISISYLKWNRSSYNIWYNNLLSRIKKLYKLFEFDVDSQIFEENTALSNKNINDLMMITDQLYAKINNWYYISEKYSLRIKWILSRLRLLNNYEFGSYKSESLEFDRILNILWKSDLYNDLKIK